MNDFNPDEIQQFQRVERIFLQICDLPIDERNERIQELCGDDDELILNVQSMLKADEDSSPLIDSESLFAEMDTEDDIPERIGEFEILRVLGEGGMGIVYEAIQDSPKRHVALKVIRQRSMHSKIRKRFEREADILAKLNHRSIATIYGSGVANDSTGSTPFVSMELVIGKPITKYCEDTSLDTDEKIRLLLEVCRGVEHAHELGIVHRDLKPSNIMVDDKGRVRILDFGIAFDMEVEQRTQMTQTGQLMGTLQYMAPEQVDQQSHATSTQTDVYALGLICYELLIGRNPLNRHESSMYDLVRAIRDEEHDLLGTINRSFRGDIETIVAKALSREMNRRYEDAGALADDLDRYLLNQPIAARKPSTWYQLRKFSKRNPVLVGSVGMIMLVLVAALILITNALREANRERIAAKHEQAVQLLINAFVTDDLFAAGDPEFGGQPDILLLEAMQKSADGIEERFADAPEAEALIRYTMGEQFRRMNDFEHAETQLIKCVEISESLNLPIDLVIDRRNALADVYMDIDELDTALKIIEVTDQLVESNPGISVEILLDTLAQHASLLYHMSDLDGAAQYFEQAVNIGRERVPESQGTIDAISALAIVYTWQERFDESVKLHHEGIELLIKKLGVDHPATLVARDNLSILNFQRGQYAEAEIGFREILEDRLRVFGQQHGKTYLTTSSLGRSLTKLERYDEAEGYLLPAYNGLVEILGPEHRYTVIVRKYLHELYTNWNKPEIAEQYAPIGDD